MKHNRFICMVYGATGVGKTDFVDRLVQSLPQGLSVEIINGDIGQMYTPLSIGTAKPDLEHATIPHHLFNSIDEPKDFTVVAYREQVEKISQKIIARGHVPIVVGGSTFYLNSLFYPPMVAGDKPGAQLYMGDDGWQKLLEVDAKRAQEIKPDDTYRVQRALAIWAATGNKPSEYVPRYNPIAPFFLICLTRDRDELYARIDERVLHMLEHGWIEEVRQLRDTPWQEFIERKKIIGYDDIMRYLDDQIDYKTMVATIQKRTRNYAKRQMTYWRMLEKKLKKALRDSEDSRSGVELVNLTSLDMQGYIETLKKKLELLCK